MFGNLQLHENGASTRFKRQWLVIQSQGNAEEIVNPIRQEVRRINWASPIVQEDLRRWIVSGEGFYYLGRSYRLKLVDEVKGQPPLKLYQSRFELQRDAQARGREEFIRWYGDRLRSRLAHTS